MPKDPRRIRRFAVPVLLALALAQAVPGFSQATRPALVIAWAELDSTALGDEYRNVAVLVPRQLSTALSFIEYRYPGAEESDRATARSAAATIESARVAVAQSRLKRDLVAISVLDPAMRASDLAAADAAVVAAEATLAKALATAGKASPASKADPDAVPLSLWPDNAQGKLLPVVVDPAAVCAEKKVDLLVYGSARLSGGFITVDLSLHVAALGRDAWKGTDHAPPDWVDGMIEAFVRPLAEAAIGKGYALVRFRASPPDANLTVDGKAFAGSRALFFEPGLHSAKASAPGFLEASTSFLVTPGADVPVDFSLDPEDSVGFALSTEPPGAAVHIDGIGAGFTPTGIEGAAFSRIIRLSMPGFEDVQLIVRPRDLLEDRTIALVPSDGRTFNDRFGGGKDAFYRSLGWFVLSLPATALSGGLFQTFFQTATVYRNSGGTDQAVISRLETG
ncbi:MAG: hypothetical protein CVV51_14500, partial [Spirochaetae bacterium HGW-Spirochaetae-7]